MFPVVPVLEDIAGLLDRVTRWTAGGNTVLVHLFTNNLVPNQNNVLGDFVELTNVQFPGYVAQAIAPVGTPYINGASIAEQDWTDPLFQPTLVPPAPVTIYGYYVTLHPLVGVDTLVYSKKFDVPKIVQFVTDGVLLDPDIMEPPFTAPHTE
jgi:hypothetical protein